MPNLPPEHPEQVPCGASHAEGVTASIVWKRRDPGSIEYGIIYGVIALLLLVAARLLPIADLLPSCLFKTATGIACPTCGATRSLVRLAQGDFLRALLYNPLTTLVVGGAVAYCLYSFTTLLFGARRLELRLSRRAASFGRIAVVLLVLANWIFCIFFL